MSGCCEPGVPDSNILVLFLSDNFVTFSCCPKNLFLGSSKVHFATSSSSSSSSLHFSSLVFFSVFGCCSGGLQERHHKTSKTKKDNRWGKQYRNLPQILRTQRAKSVKAQEYPIQLFIGLFMACITMQLFRIRNSVFPSFVRFGNTEVPRKKINKNKPRKSNKKHGRRRSCSPPPPRSKVKVIRPLDPRSACP